MVLPQQTPPNTPTGQINRSWVVESFVGVLYTTAQGGILLQSQQLQEVEEVYSMPTPVGVGGGTLQVSTQVQAAHGMSGLIGTIPASVTATVAATLLPNQFLVKVFQTPAGTLVERATGTLDTAMVFIIKGH
jgi:hypothetical protein